MNYRISGADKMDSERRHGLGDVHTHVCEQDMKHKGQKEKTVLKQL